MAKPPLTAHDKQPRESWYEFGRREAAAGLPSDPPYQRGNRHHDEYLAGYRAEAGA